MAQAAAAARPRKPLCKCGCCAPPMRARTTCSAPTATFRDAGKPGGGVRPDEGLFRPLLSRCAERLNGRPYASLICAGSDGHNAARQIERIALGWRLKPVAPPLIVCTHAQTPEDILRPKQIGAEDLCACRELGAAIAAGLVLGVF